MNGRLFHLDGAGVVELPSSRFNIEKELQTLLETDLQAFLGVRFLASEYPTGPRHGGCIDTLGLDENNFPVIIEYKRHTNESVINQGLYYLDWLMNSRAEFQLLVQKELGLDVAAEINWSSPRLICVAGDFTKFDSYAVQQINRSIELVRYARYGDAHIMLQLVNIPLSPVASSGAATLLPGPTAPLPTASPATPPVAGPVETVDSTLQKGTADLQSRFASLDDFLRAQGDDVQGKPTKLYFAYKKLRNFATVVPGVGKDELYLYLHLQPSTVDLDDRLMRDVTNIGHWGTGNLEITLKTEAELEQVKPLIQRAYEGN